MNSSTIALFTLIALLVLPFVTDNLLVGLQYGLIIIGVGGLLYALIRKIENRREARFVSDIQSRLDQNYYEMIPKALETLNMKGEHYEYSWPTADYTGLIVFIDGATEDYLYLSKNGIQRLPIMDISTEINKLSPKNYEVQLINALEQRCLFTIHVPDKGSAYEIESTIQTLKIKIRRKHRRMSKASK